jgi:hypothetical protein
MIHSVNPENHVNPVYFARRTQTCRMSGQEPEPS